MDAAMSPEKKLERDIAMKRLIALGKLRKAAQLKTKNARITLASAFKAWEVNLFLFLWKRINNSTVNHCRKKKAVEGSKLASQHAARVSGSILLF